MSLKVSVVICTKDRPKDLGNTLKTVLKQTYKPFEIIVVDASSSDTTKNLLKKYKSVIYVKQRGKGLPNARNQILKIFKGDLVAFFDDDVLLGKDWMKNVVSIFEKNPKVGGVCGRTKKLYVIDIKKGLLAKFMKVYAKIFGISGFFVILDGIGKILPSGFATINFEKIKKNVEVQWLAGFNMCYSRAAIKAVGKFDENLVGNAYYEDVDFSYRIYKKGFKLIACSNAFVDHLVTPVSREDLPKLKYNQLFNHKIFFYKIVYDKKLWKLFRFKLAHLALCFPIFFYSLYTRNWRIMKSYFKAELGLPFKKRLKR